MNKDGIPTLEALAAMEFPQPPPLQPVPGQAKFYARQRTKKLVEQVASRVKVLAEPKIPEIQKLSTWEEKQDAVDDMFESIEFQIKEEEEILGRHPKFGSWVEESLEKYLEEIQDGVKDASSDDDGDTSGEPVFMDLFDKSDGDAIVPKILHPLKVHHRDGAGRMAEEWELAAHDGTRRVMLRQCTQKIAQALNASESCRVYVTGDRGVGKVGYEAAVKFRSLLAGSPSLTQRPLH